MASESPDLPRISIVVITYRRPEVVKRNLECLAEQTLVPAQIILVDASPDSSTKQVAQSWPSVHYVHNPRGAGNMTSSRNCALPLVRGDVVSFLDDDALAQPDYVARVAAFFAEHPDVSATCSRTLNGVDGEVSAGVDSIGQLTSDGLIIGNFAADPGRHVPIDHGIGATMSFRLDLLQKLDGFREYYNGVSGVREDADVFLRARALGARACFIHDAVADHIAAPQHRGQRFDRRYRHWASRNQAILMMANFGLGSAMLRRNLRATLQGAREADSSRLRALARAGILLSGYLRGLGAAFVIFGPGPRPPVGRYERPLRHVG